MTGSGSASDYGQPSPSDAAQTYGGTVYRAFVRGCNGLYNPQIARIDGRPAIVAYDLGTGEAPLALKMDDDTWTIAAKNTECEVFNYLFGRG